jgi:hypothetical protein
VSDAIADFEKVLELEPKNKTAKMEMDKLKQQMTNRKVRSLTLKCLNRFAALTNGPGNDEALSTN